MLLRAGVLFVFSCAAGCSDRPRAAPLTTDAVYQNDKVGLRMVAPEGWFMSARTEPPAGELPKPIVLVSYVQSRGEKPADFEVILADVPEGDDLGAFLIARKIGPIKWKSEPSKQPAVIGGAEATHYQFESVGAAPLRRDIYALRRGGKGLYFVVTCSLRDSDQRDQAVRSIESTVWTR